MEKPDGGNTAKTWIVSMDGAIREAEVKNGRVVGFGRGDAQHTENRAVAEEYSRIRKGV